MVGPFNGRARCDGDCVFAEFIISDVHGNCIHHFCAFFDDDRHLHDRVRFAVDCVFAGIFKTHSNVPLKREEKNVYLLSSGVGLATFRPLVLEYLSNAEGVRSVYSLNVDSSKHYLFQDVFETNPENQFTAQFVDSRAEYYEAVKGFADDADGLYYIVGSDEFLKENIELLRGRGVAREQILLDKREQSMAEFLPDAQSV